MAKRRRSESPGAGKPAMLPLGFTTGPTLVGHQAEIHGVSWSPDGLTLASASEDKTVRLWDASSGRELMKLDGHSGSVLGVSWSPDGKTLASASGDGTARLWEASSGRELMKLGGRSGYVLGVSWSPDGLTLASAWDDNKVRLWEASSGRELRVFDGHSSPVFGLSWSPDGLTLASASDDKTVRLWEASSGREVGVLEGRSGYFLGVSWSPDGLTLATASEDRTVGLWEASSGREVRVLEGHTGYVGGVIWSRDGGVLVSESLDRTVRMWRADSWEMIATLPIGRKKWHSPVLSLHPKDSKLATLGEDSEKICLWNYDLGVLLGGFPGEEYAGIFARGASGSTGRAVGGSNALGLGAGSRTVHHITAKVVLVGDSGVGKTGLGWRLAHGDFEEQPSTHGQQWWVLDQWKHTRADGAECEAVLWDLAGQPDYRPIHALLLGDADLALILFHASNRQEPLHGVDYWLKVTHGREKPCATVLVGGRLDLGDPTLLPDEINSFCRDHGIGGGYVGTSAKQGDGLDELVELVKRLIPWDAMPARTTTATFKRIKDFVLRLKEDPKRTGILVDPAELRRRLEATGPSSEFGDDEMMTAVGHLTNYGYVSVIRTSVGETRILLVPEVLNNLAASFVLEACRNPRGLGALDEAGILKGKYRFPELDGLDKRDGQILLDAAMTLLLKNNLCFRETEGNATFLIFPELMKKKKSSLDDDIALEDDVSYKVTGEVGNAYAAMVVLLGFTNVFTRTNQWQDQAQYALGEREICGFRQLKPESEGDAEFILYYAKSVGQPTRDLFRGLFERFLTRRRVQVTRYQPVVCTKCRDRQGREEVARRLHANSKAMYCTNCGKKIALTGVSEVITPGRATPEVVHEQGTADLRTRYEAALVAVKSLARKKRKKGPSCFISYAWGNPKHERWVEKLATDLRNAGIRIILDRWHNAAIGSKISRFAAQVETCEKVIVVGTTQYRKKYENSVSAIGSVVAAEVDLIDLRYLATEEQKASVMPALLEGHEATSFPPFLRGRVYADFRDESRYFSTLFTLVLTLFGIPFDGPGIGELKDTLAPGYDVFRGRGTAE